VLKKIARRIFSILPSHYQATIAASRILSKTYGHLESARQQACITRDGKPLPWYTYPAIDFIDQLDWREKDVFEYGSGNSTLFWSNRARRVSSVESDPAWYDKIRARLPANCQLVLQPDQNAYCKAIEQAGPPYDVIVVDGHWRFRCAQASRDFLKPGGVVILDNSDWHPKTSHFLRGSGLLEVDMTGFGPINPYTWTTSFYFSRDFTGTPLHDRQPKPGAGSVDQLGDES
jgi:hypothetical protein